MARTPKPPAEPAPVDRPARGRRAKPVARHGRSVSRFTPRRWLPFLAMLGVIALGVVVASRQTTPGLAPGAAPEATAAIVPSVAERGALSSAWFCGGGTATGEGGRAELSLVIANDARRGAVADVTVYDDRDGSASRSGIAIPANGRTRLDLRDIHGGSWVAATVEVRGGRAVVDREVRGPDGFDATPCATRASSTWFVPSGSTVRGSQEYLSIFNPFPDASSVDISFATESGRRNPRALQGLAIPGGALRVVRVADTITRRQAIAATVEARTGRVVVDRVQDDDGTGARVRGAEPDAVATAAPIGLVSTPGSIGSAARWVFPGTTLSTGTRQQVATYNPGGRAARVDLVLAYEDPRQGDIEPIQLTVPAHSVVVTDLTDQPGLTDVAPFSIDVRSLDGVPVVSERLSFSGRPAKRRGASVAPGSPIAASRWLVGQGGPSTSRSSSIVVLDPGPSAVHLHVVELTGGTRRALSGADVTVAPGRRTTLDVSQAATAATIEISADGPIVVADGFSQTSGLGLASALGEPFPESIVALPPTD